MATKVKNRKRVNLSLSADEVQMLEFFSELSDQPMAAKAMEYIKRGLETDEDAYWAKMAETRYDAWVKDGKKSYSFEEVWKKHIGLNFPN